MALNTYLSYMRGSVAICISIPNCKWCEINEPGDPWVSTRWLGGKRLLPFPATSGG